MSRFATAAHLISWAGLCPKNDESAGKRRSTRMRKGAPWLKTALIQCSWAAARKNGSYIQAQFHRIRSRRGAKKAIGAVAASILTAIYHMLKNGTCYQDLGPTTSIVVPKPRRPSVSSPDFRTSATPSRSRPWRHNRILFLVRELLFADLAATMELDRPPERRLHLVGATAAS